MYRSRNSLWDSSVYNRLLDNKDMKVAKIFVQMKEKIEKYQERFSTDVYSANARMNDVYLNSYAYFITIEDLL